MAKDKERSVNPAQQQRKLEKSKALKKAKAEQQTRRNEKLARRNPDRLQRQIDDLKALESSGDIKAYEKAQLEELERDLRAVRKAREALGEKAPEFSGNRQPPRRGQDHSVLGKRQHNGERVPPRRRRDSDDGSATDDSVRRIPMPEDTPPPIPREHRRYFNQDQNQSEGAQARDGNPNTGTVAPVDVKTTYSAAPQLRDLKKEATSRFVPDIVRRKQDAVRGQGGLVEPEEMDRLEAQGYYGSGQQQPQRRRKSESGTAEAEEDQHAQRLAEEEARFAAELATMDTSADTGHHSGNTARADPKGSTTRARNVELEEVEDEDA